MYFGLSEEQVFFQDNVKNFLEDQSSLDVIRKITKKTKAIVAPHLMGNIVDWEKIYPILNYLNFLIKRLFFLVHLFEYPQIFLQRLYNFFYSLMFKNIKFKTTLIELNSCI